MVRRGLALVMSGLLLVGCAKNYVLSDDRAALWTAARTAVLEDGYDIQRGDETRGTIVGSKALRTDEKVMERNHLALAIQTVSGQYRATVLVRRSGPVIDYAATDIGIRRWRRTTGGTGRVANEYGTVAMRDFDEEKLILSRIREMLKPSAESPAASP